MTFKLFLFYLRICNHVKNSHYLNKSIKVPVVISLTSHHDRIKSLWVTLESILRGKVQPEKIFVWLDESIKEAGLPCPLKRLERRGVDFFFVEDIGPHQKYYYTIDIALQLKKAIATIDDDCIYPIWWLEELYRSHLNTNDCIVCYRSRIFSFRENTEVLPYVKWPYCNSNSIRRDVFFTGVSGVLYPSSFLPYVKILDKCFLKYCKNTDDIWLNYIAAKNKYPARQVYSYALDFPCVPMTQGCALWTTNQAGENDKKIKNIYDTETLNYIKNN